MSDSPQSFVAIVGMAGRLPDASDVHEFWRNLEQGHESLASFTDAELLESGVEPALLQNPNYVKKGTVLADADLFDAGFFGFNPREAEIMDPQHRIFLECAWHAMEDAGYAGDQSDRSVGVYAGASINTYLFNNLAQNRDVLQAAGGYQIMLGNDKDFLATRVSYKLNLKGPSVTVQTACSTSLVAVQVACQALLAGQCKMALAGGVSIHFPQKAGYLYEEGMIFSSDGHCRPFDADASGIRAGQGAVIVVLKRLDDALRDGDSIRAIIRGAAINNDGAAKMGYTAPSVEGQAEAISAAVLQSGVDPSTISYVEAHGTGTRVGDPIEIAALERVFRASTQKKQFCAIGSVKSNIGHLDAAAGIAGLVKTVLALEHKRIPASLGFQTPNPLIDFANSPFYVNDKVAPWQSEAPRRAAVSAFGIGGTNAHVVLEEAPAREKSAVRWPAQVLVLSAKTAPALENLTQQVAAYLREHPDVSLADVCYSLQLGRKTFPHRRALVCSTREDALESLTNRRDMRAHSGDRGNPAVTFMFTGQGSQYVGMARGLYQTQTTFRKWFDVCSDTLQSGLGCDLREQLYASKAEAGALNQTRMAQAALFSIEYSLARLWMSWGVQPDTMIGHSIGEFAAACLAGVFSLEDGLRLVEARGRIMQGMPAGSMLAVALPQEQLRNLVSGDLSVAAVNGPSLCTVSGPAAAIQGLQGQLQVSGVECRALHTSHAFHSSMMDPAIEPFLECLRGVKLNPPQIPFVSNLTGGYIRPEDATNPSYWANHLRQTVRFEDGIRELATQPGRIFLEVGPGQTLSAFVRDSTRGKKGFETFSSLPQPKDPQSDLPFILDTVAKLWLAGVPVNWNELHEGERLHRIPLPCYPFERQRYWVQPKPGSALPAPQVEPLARKDINDWFYSPSWIRSVLPSSVAQSEIRGPWLIFKDRNGLADRVVKALSDRGERFATVDPTEGFVRHGDLAYGINPERAEDYQRLLAELHATTATPRSILYLWGLPEAIPGRARAAFHSMLRLAQAFGDRDHQDPLDWIVVSAGLHNVNGRETFDPEQALLRGPCKVIPLEFPSVKCHSVDLPAPLLAPEEASAIVENLLLEGAMPGASRAIAYRDGYRWEQTYQPVQLPSGDPKLLRERGVYLITGGTGGIGQTLARYLAERFRARLVLTGRRPLPPRSEWEAWIKTHGEPDPIYQIIRSVEELERTGAEVLLLAADVCDRAAMAGVIDETHRHFGPINGVIHAAGIMDPNLVQLRKVEAAEHVLAPKVEGTMILDSVLQDPLDFFLLCSSISAICDIAGSVDYSAANVFLDSFASSHFRGGRASLIAINWPTWQDVGMVLKRPPQRDVPERRREDIESSISPAEGLETFRRALNSGLPQVVVATSDLTYFLDHPELWPELTAGVEPIKSSKPGLADEAHARTNLQVAYLEPETDSQKKIAAIWRELLGIEEIGIDDNFFELGGHSLLATRVLSRVRNTFGLAIQLQAIFEAPTIRLLTDHVDTLLWAVERHAASDAGAREEVEF